MKKPTIPVRICRVNDVLPLKGADNLEIVRLVSRFVITRKGDFKTGDVAVFLSPGYRVPVTDEAFSWLADPCKFDQTHHTVKEKKFFGRVSDGVIIKVPHRISCYSVGDRVGRCLGITR